MTGEEPFIFLDRRSSRPWYSRMHRCFRIFSSPGVSPAQLGASCPCLFPPGESRTQNFRITAIEPERSRKRRALDRHAARVGWGMLSRGGAALMIVACLAACESAERLPPQTVASGKDEPGAHSTDEASGSNAAGPPPSSGEHAEGALGTSSVRDNPRSNGRALEVPQLEELELGEFFPLLVVRPEGTGPFPVLVATHGAGGRAEEHCAYWWRQLGGSHLIACLRGAPLYRAAPERGFYYPDHHALGAELAKAAEALERSYAGQLQAGWTFAGYSQGATMGLLALLASKEVAFDALVLLEGGYQSWSSRSAGELHERGVRRVFFGCGGESCRRGAETAVELLVQASVAAKLTFAPGAGHTYLGGVQRAVKEALPWVEGSR